MQDVFISYAREDKGFAGWLAARLEAADHRVWWDPEIPPGSTWDEEIHKHLTKATCVVVIWSNASVTSKWVRAEAHLADGRGVLLPVVVQGACPPPPFNLTQSVDLSDVTDADDARFAAFVAQVGAFRAAAVTTSPAMGAPLRAPRPRRRLVQVLAIAAVAV